MHAVVRDSGLPARGLVVPLDGSELSGRAATVAAQLTSRLGAPVYLVSVARTQEDADLCHRQFEDVAGLVPSASRELIMADDRAVRADEVANAVVDVVRRVGGGIVCIASHGRGRSAAVLGSVATEITARSEHPVVIVGPAFRPDAWVASAPVVACVDGTASSETVVPVALEWANALGTSLSVLTVAEPIPAPVAGRQWRRMHGPDEDADRYMAALVERHRDDGVSVDGTVVYDPVSVAGGLADQLAEHPASLITVATHARTGVRRLLLGSAAAGILHQAPAPVLAVAISRDRERGGRATT
jgi:nucleotide-binding universal stress UspA family protein